MLVGLDAVKPFNALDDQRLENLLFLVIFYTINFESVPPSSQSPSGDFHILRPQAPSRSALLCSKGALAISLFNLGKEFPAHISQAPDRSRRGSPRDGAGIPAPREEELVESMFFASQEGTPSS